MHLLNSIVTVCSKNRKWQGPQILWIFLNNQKICFIKKKSKPLVNCIIA